VAGLVVMAAVVCFQSGGRLWKGRQGGCHRVMRGIEGDEMPDRFSYSCAEESVARHGGAGQRRQRLGCRKV
jgi:hypothetical protein